MRSRLTGHSRQAMARVNMRLTSASVCSGGPATSRSIAATARSGSSQRFVHLARSDSDFGGRRDGWFFLERGSSHAFVACRRIGMGQVI